MVAMSAQFASFRGNAALRSLSERSGHCGVGFASRADSLRPKSAARILSPAAGGLNCTKGKVGPYVSVGVQQHRRHGPCCGRIDAHGPPLRHGLLDRFDQLTGLKGLAQKGNATGLERLLAHGLVIEGGHEDDRKHGSGTLETPPQFNTRHPAEMDVQEETIDLSYCSTIEEFLRRCKDHGRKALCVQQALGGIEHAGIVISTTAT